MVRSTREASLVDSYKHVIYIRIWSSGLLARRFYSLGLSVGVAVVLMVYLKIMHPPAGGNTIVVMLAQDSFHYLIFPIMIGAATIIIGAVIYNRLILKKKYPTKWF